MTTKATVDDLATEAARAALIAIIERNNRVLNNQMVINAARAPDHPLHRYFEWDDSAAAEAYRLLQVSALVRHLRITATRENVATRKVELTTTRAFQSRPSMRRSGGGYELITDILSDKEKRAELLAQVVRELASYRKRYAELSELQPVWFAVDEATADLFGDSAPVDAPRPIAE